MPDHLPPPSWTDTLRTADGLWLFTQGWAPRAVPRARVVIVHGYAEHSGRYALLAARLVAEGYAVHTYDQRGYGRSEGRRAYVASFDRYGQDLHQFMAHVAAQSPPVPVFLFGHSMGGAVAACYVLDYAPPLAGLILSSPALRSNDAPLLQRLARVVGTLAPTLPTLPLDRTLLSRDQAVVVQARQDPLNYHGRYLARTGAEIIRAMRRLEADGEHLALPLLLLHGTADRITDPAATAELYERVDATDKTLELYEGLYHETFNEPEKALVIEDLLLWLEEHLS
jgi:alpha-beta hydrolase superfamily lysophospholipase